MKLELVTRTEGVNKYKGLSNEEITSAIARHGIIKEDNGKLVKYLMSEKHWSPLDMINFGFEVGNKFTISRFSNNKISFGIVADWFGASYASKKSYFPLIGNLSFGHLSVSMLEVGPTFTYALNDKMGIDLYYQLQPMAHILIVGVEDSYEDGDPAIGFSHAVGVGFRYKVFALGVEPNFGKLNNDDAFSKYKVETAQLKINLGLKF